MGKPYERKYDFTKPGMTPLPECLTSGNFCPSAYVLRDARGLACQMVCPKCVDIVKERYHPEIFTEEYKRFVPHDDDFT